MAPSQDQKDSLPHGSLALLGSRTLRRPVHEDRGLVLLGELRPRRAVAGPVDVQQLVVGNDLRIEVDLDRFAVVAEAPIGRILLLAAGVADARADDTGQTPEPGVRSPESPQREGRGFQRLRNGLSGLSGLSGLGGFDLGRGLRHRGSSLRHAAGGKQKESQPENTVWLRPAPPAPGIVSPRRSGRWPQLPRLDFPRLAGAALGPTTGS